MAVERASLGYSIHDAKTNLSKLVRRVEDGEEIVIRRGPTPVAKLVPLVRGPRDRGRGSMRGRIRIAADFDTFVPPGFDGA